VFHQANAVVAPSGSGGVPDLGEDPRPADAAGLLVSDTASELIDEESAFTTVLAVSIPVVPLMGVMQGLARRTNTANKANIITAAFCMRIPP
jgi:hypothetical protein